LLSSQYSYLENVGMLVVHVGLQGRVQAVDGNAAYLLEDVAVAQAERMGNRSGKDTDKRVTPSLGVVDQAGTAPEQPRRVGVELPGEVSIDLALLSFAVNRRVGIER
jgi:hypothetical protein